MPKIIFQDGWNSNPEDQMYNNDSPTRFEGGQYLNEPAIRALVKSVHGAPCGNTNRARALWEYVAKLNAGGVGAKDIEISLGAHDSHNPHFNVRYNDGYGYATYHFEFDTQTDWVTRITE